MKPSPDLSAYLVLDVASCGAADPVWIAHEAAEGGVRCIQLRHKHGSHADRVALGRDLMAALAPFDCPLIINDDVRAAVDIGAAGAHVGQSDMPATEARAMLGPNRVLGLSIETVAQAALVDPTVVDHGGIGPIRATATKKDAAQPLGFAGLRAAVAACRVPSVAIGGLTPEDAAPILAAGAVGLAVVSAICAQPDPRGAAAGLVAAITRT